MNRYEFDILSVRMKFCQSKPSDWRISTSLECSRKLKPVVQRPRPVKFWEGWWKFMERHDCLKDNVIDSCCACYILCRWIVILCCHHVMMSCACSILCRWVVRLCCIHIMMSCTTSILCRWIVILCCHRVMMSCTCSMLCRWIVRLCCVHIMMSCACFILCRWIVILSSCHDELR